MDWKGKTRNPVQATRAAVTGEVQVRVRGGLAGWAVRVERSRPT